MSDFSKLPPVEYEARDVDARSISRAGVVVGGALIVSAFVALGFFRFLQHQDQVQRAPLPAVAQHAPFRQPPEPRLQRLPFDDIRKLRSDEQSYLGEYGWVEKDRVVRIPIEQAVRLYVARAAAGNAATPFTVAPMESALVPVPPDSRAREAQR